MKMQFETRKKLKKSKLELRQRRKVELHFTEMS